MKKVIKTIIILLFVLVIAIFAYRTFETEVIDEVTTEVSSEIITEIIEGTATEVADTIKTGVIGDTIEVLDILNGRVFDPDCNIYISLVSGESDQERRPCNVNDGDEELLPISIRLSNVSTMDLGSDGTEEGLYIEHKSTGGSGVFTSFVVVRKLDDMIEEVARHFIGDRDQVSGISISGEEDRSITITYITHGEGDALCCPTLEASLTLVLNPEDNIEVLSDEMVLE